jgi:hypothetical protein
VFWVISVYFNIRNTLPKFCPFLLGHPVYTGADPDFMRPETYTISGALFKKENTKLSTKVFTGNEKRNHNKLQI